jgi:hypothetical protein
VTIETKAPVSDEAAMALDNSPHRDMPGRSATNWTNEAPRRVIRGVVTKDCP